MTSPRSEQDVKKTFQSLVAQATQNALKESINNVREAYIFTYTPGSRTAEVQLLPERNVVKVQLAKHINFLNVGDRVLLVAPDRSNLNNYYLVAVLSNGDNSQVASAYTTPGYAIGVEYTDNTSLGELNIYINNAINRIPTTGSPAVIKTNTGIVQTTQQTKVTLPGGTSYFRAGSSDLNGSVLDLFVYTASDVVPPVTVISRLPYLTSYAGLTNEITNDYYGAFDTGVTFPIDTKLSNIGRVSVALSGTSLVWNTAVDPEIVSTPSYRSAGRTYTPLWLADVSDPVLRNGLKLGNYYYDSDQVYVTLKLIPGTSTTFGSGNWRFGLPSPFKVNTSPEVIGQVTDSGVADYLGNFAFSTDSAGTSLIRFFGKFINMATGTRVTGGPASNLPFTWGASDFLAISFSYQV